MLDAPVLVLNRSYLPIHVTSVKRAFTLLYRGLAKAVDEQPHLEFERISVRRLFLLFHEVGKILVDIQR